MAGCVIFNGTIPEEEEEAEESIISATVSYFSGVPFMAPGLAPAAAEVFVFHGALIAAGAGARAVEKASLSFGGDEWNWWL